MNYHVVRLLSRIASESASTVVWLVFDKYRKNSFGNTHRGSYRKRNNYSSNKNVYYSTNKSTKRPYVQKEKPHKSLFDQVRTKRDINERTNKLNGK